MTGEWRKRPTFSGARVRAYVETAHSMNDGTYYQVSVAREEWEDSAYKHDDEHWRMRSEGVMLPIRFRFKHRADALVRLLNTFFRRHPHADVRADA